MAQGLKDLMAAAKAAVPQISADDAQTKIAAGDALVLDVRETGEVENSGKVPGALHIPRGLLEFRADAESPMHLAEMTTDKTIIVYCASGGRAALAGKTLKDMGFGEVYNLGGLKDWTDADKPTEPAQAYHT